MIWISVTGSGDLRGFIKAPNFEKAQNIADATGDAVMGGLTNSNIETLFYILPTSIQKRIAKKVLPE